MGNIKKLEFEIIGDINDSKICLIFIHGWKGNKDSFKRVSKSFIIDNSVWVLPQAPYHLDDDNSFSWTHEVSPGKYERREPVKLLTDFFKKEVFP